MIPICHNNVTPFLAPPFALQVLAELLVVVLRNDLCVFAVHLHGFYWTGKGKIPVLVTDRATLYIDSSLWGNLQMACCRLEWLPILTSWASDTPIDFFLNVADRDQSTHLSLES